MTTDDVMLLVVDALNRENIENWCRLHGTLAQFQELRSSVEGKCE